MTLSEFVGHEDGKLAMVLDAIDLHCGGILFTGEKGTGKSTLSRLMNHLLPEGAPFVELPLNITEDALLGGTDIEATLKMGTRYFQPGILTRADQGVIYIDDVNLLPPEILTLVLEAQGKGENIVEREGLSIRRPSRFILIASMNPDEAVLSPHLLDRFGMCVLWESLKDNFQKVAIMKAALPEVFQKTGLKTSDDDIRRKIRAARKRLEHIAVPSRIEEYISQLCLENNISGHRGDLFLFHGARAYAAFLNEEAVREEHVNEVLPLVLGHRGRILEQMEQTQEENNTAKPDQDPKDRPEKPHEKDRGKMSSPAEAQEGSTYAGVHHRESSLREEIFEVGNPFPVRRMVFGKDRQTRVVSGRRTKTRSKGKGGRYVKSIFSNAREEDIAIDATIRAAVPFQKIRLREGILVIKKEDLRFKQRERKMGHLVIFLVDGSGSMGAQRRMVETKGAIQSLLIDCYLKRDRVSLIVFRKDKAEVVLPPTASVEVAARRLKDIPVGGKTPLPAGLLQAYQLIKRVQFKEPQTRFLLVVITDGRANQSMAGAPVGEEVEKTTFLLGKLKFIDYVVVDTEDKKSFTKTDLALQIALRLGADYYTVKELRSEYLTDLVQMKKAKAAGA